jgi:hypothetical protein
MSGLAKPGGGGGGGGMIPHDIDGAYHSPKNNLNLLGSLNANLDASKIVSGILSTARIPDLDASKIVSGIFAKERIPDISAKLPIFKEEFMNGRDTDWGEQGWYSDGQVSVALAETGKVGVVELQVAAINTCSSIYLGVSAMKLSGKEIIEIDCRLPALSDATNEYIARMGIGNVGGADFVEGIYFEYDRTSSTNWRYCTASTSTRTKNNSTIPVSTDWTKLKIVVNADISSVEYFINDISVGTITTNIPATTIITPVLRMYKTAGSSMRTLKVDSYILSRG